MRKTHKVLRDVFLLSILVLLSFKAHAQFNVNATGVTLRQILDTSIRYAELSGDTTEGGKIRTARSIEAFWSSRVSKNDSSHINMFGLYYKTLNQAVLAKYAGTCTGSGQFQGAWRCIGPDKLDKQAMGYVECVWADPDDDFTTTTGPRRLLAGTYGGLFKSTDGGGQWKCITDNAPIANGINLVSSIAVRPGDKSVIYLGMGGVSGGGHYWESFQGYGVTGLYGASILKTSDGGQNWQQEKVGTANSPGDEFDRVQKVFFTPSGNYLIAFKNERIFIRAYNSTTWDEITTSNNNPLATFGNAAQWRDLEFVPGDPNADNHFYIASAHSLNAPTAGGAFEVTKS